MIRELRSLADECPALRAVLAACYIGLILNARLALRHRDPPIQNHHSLVFRVQ